MGFTDASGVLTMYSTLEVEQASGRLNPITNTPPAAAAFPTKVVQPAIFLLEQTVIFASPPVGIQGSKKQLGTVWAEAATQHKPRQIGNSFLFNICSPTVLTYRVIFA